MTESCTRKEDAFEFIRREIYNRCRIKLDSSKHALIRARLGKRMRHHGFAELSEYCDWLKTTANEDEFTCVVDALTTNFTNFMREPDHFEFLVSKALPELMRGDKSIRVWSAASSTGEEPYTIGFFLETHFPAAAGWSWNVEASDVSTRVIEQARAGIYTADRLNTLPREWLPSFFQQGVGEWAGHLRVKRAISDRTKFSCVNLIEEYSHASPFQVIFCRNVMIYFDRATQQELVSRLCRFLVPGGYVIVGHSESLTGLCLPLRCVRPSIYKKV